jgi:hypothetical protein
VRRTSPKETSSKIQGRFDKNRRFVFERVFNISLIDRIEAVSVSGTETSFAGAISVGSSVSDSTSISFSKALSQSIGSSRSWGLSGSSTTRHSLRWRLYLGRFLPFPGTNPSSSLNGSKAKSPALPEDFREDLWKAGDPQDPRVDASGSLRSVEIKRGVEGGSGSCCAGSSIAILNEGRFWEDRSTYKVAVSTLRILKFAKLAYLKRQAAIEMKIPGDTSSWRL